MNRRSPRAIYRLGGRALLLVMFAFLLSMAHGACQRLAPKQPDTAAVPESSERDSRVPAPTADAPAGEEASTIAESDSELPTPVLVPVQTTGYVPRDLVVAEWGEGAGEIGFPPGAPDLSSTGPTSIAVDASSNVYVIDSVHQRILQFDSDGEWNRTVEYSVSVGALDVAASSGGDLYLLDGTHGRLLAYNAGGEMVGETVMPPTVAQAYRVVVGMGDRLMVEGIRPGEGGGSPFANVTLSLGKAGPRPEASSSPGQLQAGQPTSGGIHSIRLVRASDTSGLVEISGPDGDIWMNAAICTRDPLAGVALVDVHAEGSAFVRIDTLQTLPDATIIVRSEVARFSRDGVLLGTVELPDAYYTPVYQPVAVDSEGRVHVLLPAEERVRVVRWEPTPSAGTGSRSLAYAPAACDWPGQADWSLFSPGSGRPAASNEPAVTFINRDTIMANAEAYRTYAWTVSDDNLHNRTCYPICPVEGSTWSTGRQTGVAYAWGGFDFIDGVLCYSGCEPNRDYQAKLEDGAFVGDTATGCVPDADCTAGVDCSGFVSRAWEEDRYTTSTLGEITHPISIPELLRGDIFLGMSHVVLFSHFDEGGQPVYYEVTNAPPYKVWLDVRAGWPGVSGFTTRRYKYVGSS